MGFFSEVFRPRPPTPYGTRPKIFQIKILIVIHNPGKFHQDSICGSKVKNFQMFSWPCSSHELSPFWVFLSPFYPKYGSNMLKFGPEVFHCEKITVCEQCFKIRCFSTNRTFPKFWFLAHFWVQFTPRKQ